VCALQLGMDLPPPQSGLFLEVSFLRLLRSCEEILAGDSKGRSDLEEWATSPVFHHVCLQSARGRAASVFIAIRVLLLQLCTTSQQTALSMLCVFAQYVETLQEQLSDLQNETGTKRCARLPHKL